MDVVPIAGKRNRKDENGNQNHAGSFQFSVWRGSPALELSTVRAIKSIGARHGSILSEPPLFFAR